MKTNLKRLIALFLTAAALSSLAACGSPSSSGSQEVPAVRVPVTVLWQKSRRSFITAWSPAPVTPFGMSRPERRLLRCLRACIAGIRGELVLGQGSVKYREDGLTYTTITLRDDIYWSDGEPVTSDDFIYSWMRELDPNTAAKYVNNLYCIENAQAYNSGECDASEVGIKKVDDKVFTVTLSAPLSALRSCLRLSATCRCVRTSWRLMASP